MATLNPVTTSFLSLPARAAGRFKASMESSALVGPDSAAVRFAKIQWIVIFWRCLILAEVAIFAAACPSCYFPLEHAIVILSLGLAHTLVFSWMRVRTSLTGTWPFYFIDFAISMAIMILAMDGTLVLVVSFYATTALFVRPMVKFSQAIALSGLASMAFLAAMYLASPVAESAATVADYALLFLFWGFAWVLACRLMERAAMLEIDMHLEAQRRSFRRRLHDDLGNTLCGLHFKIQSLFRIDRSDMGPALNILAQGYERAGVVLDRILTGIEGEGGCASLEDLRQITERDFSIRVNLTGYTGVIYLSPAVRQEVFSIIREALANSAKHSGTTDATINVSRSRKQLEIAVSDQGSGFSVPAAGDSQHEGGLGLGNMLERAKTIGAELDFNSQPGAGTEVILSISENEVRDDPGGRLSSRLIDSDAYLVLVRLKVPLLIVEYAQFLISGSAVWSNPAALLVMFLTTAEAFAWLMFREQLQDFFKRRPWWLILDLLFFCLLVYYSWRAGIPIFVAETLSLTICLSAWFLGPLRNLILALILGAGLVFASAMAPPDAAAGILRQEELFIDVMDNIILAVIAGFAFEFVRSIDTLRAGLVDIALERNRAALSAETHRGLYELVESIRNDVSSRQAPGHSGPMQLEFNDGFVSSLETRSTMLKSRLRKILSSIDEPVDNR